MQIRPLEPRDQGSLERFVRRIPASDRTFFKEAVDDPAVLAAWAQPDAARWLAIEGDRVLCLGRYSRERTCMYTS